MRCESVTLYRAPGDGSELPFIEGSHVLGRASTPPLQRANSRAVSDCTRAGWAGGEAERPLRPLLTRRQHLERLVQHCKHSVPFVEIVERDGPLARGSILPELGLKSIEFACAQHGAEVLCHRAGVSPRVDRAAINNADEFPLACLNVTHCRAPSAEVVEYIVNRRAANSSCRSSSSLLSVHRSGRASERINGMHIHRCPFFFKNCFQCPRKLFRAPLTVR